MRPMPIWPYPRIVAHRGGGALAPENTLGAIRLGGSLGFRGVEFDVMLSSDKAPVLIHDETTERTTGVQGEVPRMLLADLKKLKAGGNEPIPTFEEAGTLCRKLGVWANVEIKPAVGYERETGEAVARMARELWRGADLQPLLSSFSLDALAAARAVAPELARGYLVDEIPAAWQEDARRLRCVAIHCNHEKLSEPMAKAIRAAGYGLLCWTVNDPAIGRRLLSWGVDCLVTDALRDIGPGFA
jgi:glycerophosphoryl diester phosphodiesterase